MNTIHQSVRAALEGVPVVIHDNSAFAVEIGSPADFARESGVPIERVGKSFFLRSEHGEFFVAVLGMARRVDFKKLAVVVGAKPIELAKPEELQEILGFPRNGVSPVGVLGHVFVVLDAEFLNHPTITIGGGATGVEIELSPQAVADISHATVAEVSAS